MAWIAEVAWMAWIAEVAWIAWIAWMAWGNGKWYNQLLDLSNSSTYHHH
jgi:hypothetical protein